MFGTTELRRGSTFVMFEVIEQHTLQYFFVAFLLLWLVILDQICLLLPKENKFNGIKCGEYGGLLTGPLHLFQQSGNC
jgi:hypothetical protein